MADRIGLPTLYRIFGMLLSLFCTNALLAISCSKSGGAPSDIFRQTGNLFRQNDQMGQVTKFVKMENEG